MRSTLLIMTFVGMFWGTTALANPTLDEIVAEWDRYELAMKTAGLRGTIHTKSSLVQGKTTTNRELETTFAISSTGTRVEYDGKQGGEAYGFNRFYSFRLSSPKRNGDWLVVRLGDLGAEDDTRNRLGVIWPTTSPLLDLFGDSLVRLGKEGQLQVKEATPDRCVLTGKDLQIKLHNGNRLYRELELVLDPKRSFTLQSGRCVVKLNKTDGIVQLDCTSTLLNDCAVPTRIVVNQDFTSSGASLIIHQDKEFRMESGVKFSPEEFGLTHYGLPEPPGVVWQRPTPIYVWLLIAAGGFGVIALGCRWLLKRRAKPISPPPPSVA